MPQKLRKEENPDRPYERCLMKGASALSDAELIAVILRSGIKGRSAVALAEQILSISPAETGLMRLTKLSASEYMKIPGVGEVKAIQLECVGELSKRIASRTARSELEFSEPETVANYFMEKLRHEDQENLMCVMLDSKLHPVGEELITKGTANLSVASPREIILAALRHRAVSFVMVHNHPSGDPTPSANDILITERVLQAGELIDVHLVDHIIIGDKCYFSFLEEGFMDKETTC